MRFNFVVAAHLVSALHSSVFARLASGALYETIVLVAFYEIIKIVGIKIGGNLREKFGFRIELAKGLPQPGIGREKMIFEWKLEMNYAKKHHYSLILKKCVDCHIQGIFEEGFLWPE